MQVGICKKKYTKSNKIFSKNFNLQTFMTLALTELIFEPITLKRLILSGLSLEQKSSDIL